MLLSGCSRAPASLQPCAALIRAQEIRASYRAQHHLCHPARAAGAPLPPLLRPSAAHLVGARRPGRLLRGLCASATARRGGASQPGAAVEAVSTAAQQQQQQRRSSSSMTAVAPAPAPPASQPAQQQQQQQQQQQPPQQPQLQPQPGSPGAAQLLPVPSLDDPTTVPLHVADDGSVRDAAGSVLLERLGGGVALNAAASRDGALVFGASSERGPAACWDVVVGHLKFRRFLACARNKLWWMTPEWGRSLGSLPPETQFLLLELEEPPPPQQQQQGQGQRAATYAVVLPLIDGDFRGTLRPSRSWTDRDGQLCLRMESGDDAAVGGACDAALLLAASTDPFHLVDAAVAAAAALSGGAAPRAAKHLPSSIDGFGWCTWDAFYSTVSARGLVEGLASLAAGGVAPRTLIIDDGWQLTDVDDPYGRAPTAQLADRLVGDDHHHHGAADDPSHPHHHHDSAGGDVADLLEGARAMVLDTQDAFFAENAKLLAEASEQMRQEVRNLFPTVANTGAISHHHHHAPPPPGAAAAASASSWDAPAPADAAAAAAKEGEPAAAEAAAGGDAAAAKGAGTKKGPAGRSSSGAARRRPAPVSQREAPAPLQSVDDSGGGGATDSGDEGEGGEGGLVPDWARARSPAAYTGAAGRRRLLPPGGQGAAASSADAQLRAAIDDAEGKLRAARAEAQGAVRRALKRAAPTPRQQFVLIRWAQKAAGAVVGVATAAFLLFYQWVVEPAPPNSLRVRAFAALAQGALRGAMLTFFASASDFTRRLTSVEANAKFSRLDAGPEEDWEGTRADLRSVVTSIKQRFGVRHVYCWHGLPAYWGGVMPGAPALAAVSGAALVYPRPTASIAEVEPSLLWSPAVLAGVGIADDPGAMYGAMHGYLAASAVDGVKVDCQAGVGLVGSCLGGGPAASRRFQAALEASIATHFPGNHAINCMCHSSENFYRFTRTAVARVSDDYYPRDPASSTPHIGACAFNSLYLGALVQPDWDMFQSAHPAGVLHGMARAVSGGAVYVSDKPSQHDFSLLRRLVLPGGGVLRAALPGRPTRDCLFRDVLRDGRTLLKVWNLNPVVGVVGLFNLQGASWDRTRRKFHVHDRRGARLEARVAPRDVDAFRPGSASAAALQRLQQRQQWPQGGGGGRWDAAAAAAGVAGAAGTKQQQQQQLEEEGGNGGDGADEQQQQQQRYAVYRYGTEELAVCGAADDGLRVALDPAGSDLVWVSPVAAAGGVEFAPLGLAEMFNGGGAVLAFSLDEQRQQLGGGAAGAAAAAGAAGGAAGGAAERVVVAAASAAAAAAGTNGGTNGGGGGGRPSVVGALRLRGCGRFLAYCTARPRAVLVNLAPRNFRWDEFTSRLEFDVPLQQQQGDDDDAAVAAGGAAGAQQAGGGGGGGDACVEVEVLWA